MQFSLIILLVAVSLVGSIYIRFKRVLAETSDPETSDDQQNDASIFDYDDNSAVAAPYFSYEYESASSPQTSASQEKKKAPTAPQPVAHHVERSAGFDLRQAVIYRTILDNPYIDE